MMEVYITGCGTISPAGVDFATNLLAHARGQTSVVFDQELQAAVGRLDAAGEAALAAIAQERALRRSDRAVLLGVLAARQAMQSSPVDSRASLGVIIGSSRGVTCMLEDQHARFLSSGQVASHTSPSTTAGAFAASVARDLGAGGLSLSVSSACATSLNAVGVGFAMLQAGILEQAVVGGTEASITAFTIAQLRAVGVLAKSKTSDKHYVYSCPYHPERTGMALGEGAACLWLSRQKSTSAVRVAGFGASTELVTAAGLATATGISPDGDGLVQAMQRAMQMAGIGPQDIDLIVGHGASTVKGDAAELAAYRQIFDTRMPPLLSHKWMTGHMLGAAGAYSLALAVGHMQQAEIPSMPYALTDDFSWKPHRSPQTVLVNALGFGGQAAAVVLQL